MTRRRRHSVWPFSMWMTLVVMVLLYMPIVYVFLNAFNANKTLINWGGFTFHWFGAVISSSTFRSAFRSSLLIALGVMFLSSVVGISAALGNRALPRYLRAVKESTTYLRIVLPEVVIVVGVFIIVHGVFGLAVGPWWVILAQSLVNGAYATVVIIARLKSLGNTYENAAADLGVSPWRTVWRVTLPLLAPAVFVSALMAFTFSLDDVVTVVFLGGPNTQTIPILILGLVRQGVTPEVNAMGVVLTVFNLLVLMIIVRVVGLRGAFTGGVSSVVRATDHGGS